MDKTRVRSLSLFVILAIILTFFIAFTPSASSSAHQPRVATPSPVPGTPSARVATPAPTAVDRTVPGSTDGIVIMSTAIALIIVLPILLQKGLWGK